MRKMGDWLSKVHHTLFIKHSTEGKVTILLEYVDDIIVTGDDNVEQRLKEWLARKFEIKVWGRLKYFLKIEGILQRRRFSFPKKHVLDLLEETGFLGGKATSTPVKPNFKIGDNLNCKSVDKGTIKGWLVVSYIYPTLDLILLLSWVW